MRVSSWKTVLGIAAALGCAGCASNPAPGGWLPSGPRVGADPRGGWIEISRRNDAPEIRGEFLAVESDTVYVLATLGLVQRVPLEDVDNARIAFFDPETTPLVLWTVAGMASTISNGAFAIFTLPTWIIGGVAATGEQSRAPLADVEGRSGWSAVRKYARFPAGLPPAGLPDTLPPAARP